MTGKQLGKLPGFEFSIQTGTLKSRSIGRSVLRILGGPSHAKKEKVLEGRWDSPGHWHFGIFNEASLLQIGGGWEHMSMELTPNRRAMPICPWRNTPP